MGILIIFIIWAVGVLETVSPEPVCHLAEVGICFDHITGYINSLAKRTIPKTRDDVNNMCNEIENLFDCWDDYKERCMTPIQSGMEALVVEGVRDLKDRFCSPDSDLSTRYMRHSECLDQVVASDSTTSLIKRILVMFEKFDGVPNSRKIRYVCCGWNKMYSAIRQSSLEACGPEATESAEELLSMAISTLPNVLCHGFDPEEDECRKVLPPEGVEPTGRPNPIFDGLRYFFKNHLD